MLPSNEGRGYVLRKLVRRAVRHGRLLGRREPFLDQTAAVVIDVMGEAYPHLVEARDTVLGTIIREEAQFGRTLDAGTVLLEEALIPLTSAERQVGRRPEDLPPDAPQLPGEVGFRLHDTYRLPDRPDRRAGCGVRRRRRPRRVRGRRWPSSAIAAAAAGRRR